MNDEEEPRKQKHLEKPDFETYSIEALNDYIEELQMEIDRAKAAIGDKNSARSAADAVFKA